MSHLGSMADAYYVADGRNTMQEIDRLRADLTDFGRQAVAYWMERTGCSELEALRHVSGGPALLQPGHKLGRGWR